MQFTNEQLKKVPNPIKYRESTVELADGWLFSFDGETWQNINVPYAPQSELSGIGYTDFIYKCFYKKTFSVSPTDKRVIINFGAVDYECELFINGKSVGTHKGGYASFAFDITEALEAEKRRIENERLAVIGKEHFADAIKKHGKPVALILAVEHEDVSDLQTDYFDYRTVRTVVLAFSKHKRNLFPEMRKAALNSDIPEIRKLATAPADWENREDYSGGHGYYLAESKYSGWSIEKIPLYNDEQLERFYCNAGKPGGFCVK